MLAETQMREGRMDSAATTKSAVSAAASLLAALGGTARAKKLSARRQSEIARIAANARWARVKRKAK